MRLWSIHPKYLDSKGIVALWREALLAKAVIEEKTKGYKNHPQLRRFRESVNPVACINQYLAHVYDESLRRNYHFNRNKIDSITYDQKLSVTNEQMKYEYRHLMKKLKSRDNPAYISLSSQKGVIPHPLFRVVLGDIEQWEIIS